MKPICNKRRIWKCPLRLLLVCSRVINEAHVCQQLFTVPPMATERGYEELVIGHQPPFLHGRVQSILQVAVEDIHGGSRRGQLHVSIGLSLRRLSVPLLKTIRPSEKLTIVL